MDFAGQEVWTILAVNFGIVMLAIPVLWLVSKERQQT